MTGLDMNERRGGRIVKVEAARDKRKIRKASR